MGFLRLHGAPTPKVLDWSSSVSNQVGSEYIIMERVPGRELGDTWYAMTPQERMAVVEKIVDVEKPLFGIQFPASGSLFFKDSLDANVKSVNMPENHSIDEGRFCIGPSTEYLWWYQRRDELAANHGPWKSTEELLKAVGERELMWLRRYGERRHPREPLYREFYGRQMIDPQVQMNLLVDYLKVAPNLVPETKELNVPTIRHPDLSPSNIFITDSGDITGAKIPKHFQNYGDEDSENFRPPKLVQNFDTLTDSDKKREVELYRRRQVHYFYVGFTNRISKAHFHAMGKYNLVVRNKLYDTARRPWEGDTTSLQAELVNVLAHWSEIASPGDEPSGPPVQYSPADIKECLYRNAKQKDADAQMGQLRDFIGVNIEGWVPTKDFESAREKAQHVKREMLEAADTEETRELNEHWPFQDHEEID